MEREEKSVPSCGNVFEDLGLNDADELDAKAALVFQISQIIKSRNITQTQAGEVLGVDQSEVSKLLRGDLDNFSIQRLLTFVTRLNRDVEIVIRDRESSPGRGQMTVVVG